MELNVCVRKKLNAFYLDVDFNIQGERIGIFGPSGCGKSTLVGLIAGLNHPDQGRVVIDGQPVFDTQENVNIQAQNRQIGMVFQRPHLFPHLSVKANLLYGYNRCLPDRRKITPEHLVDVLQIGDLLHRGVNNLSGGEQQRVALGRAVLSNPRMLILDEPLSALHDSLKFQIIPFLRKTCEVFAIPYLFISHSLTEMRILTEEVLCIENGRVTGKMMAEELARDVMGKGPFPYINLLPLKAPRKVDGLYAYPFGDGELLISAEGRKEALFELPSTDIILFKRHPEAISARNLLKCSVGEMYRTGSRTGVELKYGSARLVAVVVEEAVRDLEIREGTDIFAAIKATAFRQLG